MINNTRLSVLSKSRIFLASLLFSVTFQLALPATSQGQVSCTGNVPTFTLDFTGLPGGTWVSPALTREGNCCGTTSPDRCLRIEVTADTGAAAISFQIESGAIPPGALFYQVDCGPQTQVGSYTCITGNGILTFCKPGNNTNTYRVTSIPKPRFPGDDSVRFGCAKTVQLLGFRDDSVTINSIFPGTPGQYNSYLSCTTGCSDPLVTPGPNAPPYVDYLVSGYPIADLCGYNVRLTDTVRIYFFPGLEASVTPSPATYCPSSPGTTLTASAAGGAGGYTYTWYSGATVISTSDTYQATAPGNFQVIVQDALFRSCPSDTVDVPVALANIAIGTTVTNASCFNFTNGTATANVTGGTPPFTYEWTSGSTVVSTDQTATGLGVGTYSVTVTDAGGCANTTTVTITDPPALTITPVIITNVGCNGESTGGLQVDVNGGTLPYQFSWSNGETTEDLFNIPADTYTLTVTDTQGCVQTFTQEITQPSQIDSLITGATLTVVNVSCYGGTDGSVAINVSGGTPPYNYFWSDGSTDSLLVNQPAGPVEVLVRDANGCSSTTAITITEPDELTANIQSISLYQGAYNVTCNGATDGSVDLEVAGGTPAYSYSWSNGDLGQDLNGIGAGTYDVTITDANGCTATTTATLNEPSALGNVLTSPVFNGYNIPCKGDTSGIIYSSATGGTEPYTWNWSNGASDDTVAYVPAGNYDVTVTDANGCTIQQSIILTEPDTLFPRISATLVAGNFNIGCNGDSTGSAWVTVTGGTAPFQFLWSNGSIEDTLTQLPAGDLWVVVRDTNLCFGTDTAMLTQPDRITAFISVNADASCNGNADGQAVAVVSGGTPGYSYSWSNGGTTDTLQLASAGTYYLTVTDQNNCVYLDSIQISQPDVLTASATPFAYPSGDNISCTGASDGSIDLTVTGGTGPFTYVWSNTATSEDISNLAYGNYSVTVTDANGCETQASTNLVEPVALVIDTIFSPEYFGGWNVSCNGGTNGAVNIDVSGGSPGYTYYWSNGETTQDIANVSVFIYYVTVTDLNGCTAQDSLWIDEPTLLNASANSQQNVDCNGNSTGSVTISASGSTPPYRFSLDGINFTNDSVFTGLAAGSYTFTVVDTNGCSTTQSVVISEPAAALSASFTQTDVACNGFSTGSFTVSATGGTSPYTFSLNSGSGVPDSTFSNLTAGSYDVLVTDANGCSYTISPIVINESTPIVLTFSSTPSNCNTSNGSVTVVAAGGAEYFTYAWSPGGATTELVTGLAPGSYDVVVTDALGCTSTGTATVNSTALLTAGAVPTDNVCFGQSLGSATVTASNGTAPYTYAWSPIGGNGATATGLPAGTYSCTITDQDNCSTTVTVSIAEPTAVQATITTDPPTCTGAASGSASVAANGGTPAYTYAWSTGATTSTVSGLAPGAVSVTVTDNNGCTGTASATVSPASNVSATVSGVGVTCFGYTDGTASVTNPSGAYPPFTYLWSNNETGSSISGLSPGSYSVVVTDAQNCSISVSVSIGEPAQLSVNAGSDTSVCASSIELNATGNYPGLWSSSNTAISFTNASSPTSSVSGYVSGVNVLTWTITDGTCSNSADVRVTLLGREECELELPSGFTPNADGFNDGYVIHGIGLYPDNVFRVFNRWGNEVYNREDYQNTDWVGQNNDGDPLPDGTYFVILEIVGKNIQKNTYVDLRRGK